MQNRTFNTHLPANGSGTVDHTHISRVEWLPCPCRPGCNWSGPQPNFQFISYTLALFHGRTCCASPSTDWSGVSLGNRAHAGIALVRHTCDYSMSRLRPKMSGRTVQPTRSAQSEHHYCSLPCHDRLTSCNNSRILCPHLMPIPVWR